MDLVGLAVQLVSGAAGGIGAGKAMPKFSLGTAGNIISGLVGGGIGGQILSSVLGSAVGGGGMDIGSIIGSVASSGVGGGGLMVIIGLVKKALAK